MEVAKPKGRQGAKKKAPAADVKADDDEMMDLAQRLAQYNFGSTSENPSSKFLRNRPQLNDHEVKNTFFYAGLSTEAAISLDDDEDDVVVEVAAPAKGGRKPAAASKAVKPPAAPRKRGPAASKKQPAAEVVTVSPEKKVRKMRSSPFNKKSSSVLGRLANKEGEEESTETVAVGTSSRPKRANRKQMKYVLSDSESESGNDSEFDDIEDVEDDDE